MDYQQVKTLFTPEQREMIAIMFPDTATAPEAIRASLRESAEARGLIWPEHEFQPGHGGKRPNSGRKRKAVQPQQLGDIDA